MRRPWRYPGRVTRHAPLQTVTERPTLRGSDQWAPHGWRGGGNTQGRFSWGLLPHWQGSQAGRLEPPQCRRLVAPRRPPRGSEFGKGWRADPAARHGVATTFDAHGEGGATGRRPDVLDTSAGEDAITGVPQAPPAGAAAIHRS